MSEDDPEQPPTDAKSSPADAFALVGHEIRAETIEVLGASGELTLSELRTQLETDVDPSQLHYHLQQLVGHFVKKTESGYKLHTVGRTLYRNLRAGTFDRQLEHMSVEAGVDCYHCQAPVKAVFDDGFARVVCSDCGLGYAYTGISFPLDTFEDEASAFSHFCKSTALGRPGIARGVCPTCEVPISREIHPLDSQRREVNIYHSCDNCGGDFHSTVGMTLLGDPELIGFCHDHGVDILTTPWWELEFAATDKHVTVLSTDPWEIAVEISFDDDTLELVVDGDLNVIERNRRDAGYDGSTSSPSGVQGGGQAAGSNETKDEVILPDKTDCLQSLRRHRWPDGMTCPHCDSTDVTKEGTTTKDTQRYRCHNCESIFNDLTGTIFAERHLSIPEMFHIIQEIEEKDQEAIARPLDRSDRAVRDFVREVRDARAGDLEFELFDACNVD